MVVAGERAEACAIHEAQPRGGEQLRTNTGLPRQGGGCGSWRFGIAEEPGTAASFGSILNTSFEFLLLASSPRIPLQTSNVQVVNGTAGAAMSLIKKSDVKNHLSTRTGATEVPARPVIHADATGYSEEEGAVNAEASNLLSGVVELAAEKPKA